MILTTRRPIPRRLTSLLFAVLAGSRPYAQVTERFVTAQDPCQWGDRSTSSSAHAGKRSICREIAMPAVLVTVVTPDRRGTSNPAMTFRAECRPTIRGDAGARSLAARPYAWTCGH